MTKPVFIYCCGCYKLVSARLTTGSEVYPNHFDLKDIPYWKCDSCGNWVGCHHKTKQPARPLGCIPTPEIKELRRLIHHRLDPLWKYYGIPRKDIYAMLSKLIGQEYHTAAIKSVVEAETVLNAVNSFREEYEEKLRQDWNEKHCT